MVVLVVAMQTLCFTAGPNFHAESSVHDRIAGVGVSGFAIVVVGGFVDEGGEELIDEWIDKPLFTDSFGARDEASTAAGFGREEVALRRLKWETAWKRREHTFQGLSVSR